MNNLGVKTRLFTEFGLVLALLIVVAELALLSLSQIYSQITPRVDGRYPALVKSNQ